MNAKLSALDNALKEKHDRDQEFKSILDVSVNAVYKKDLQIALQEKVLARLEKEKQELLEKVRDDFELAIRNSHKLDNGYEVKLHGMRPMEIVDIKAFLKWLKENIPPTEVLEFFSGAIGKRALKSFVIKYCDNQRLKGVHDPVVDGIDIKAINFRRLTTSLTKGRD